MENLYHVTYGELRDQMCSTLYSMTWLKRSLHVEDLLPI